MRALGSFLSEPEPVPAAVVERRVSKAAAHRAEILRALEHGPQSASDLRGLTRMTTDAVNTALWLAGQHGLVEKAGTRPQPVRGPGMRRAAVLYALTFDGRRELARLARCAS